MTGQKPIVVVGSINMDLVARTPRIPLAGETLTGSGFETTPGGKGANQAVAIARLGFPVAMVGMVGDDVFGNALLDHLGSAGVQTGAIARVQGPSGVAQIQVAENGQNCIIVVPGANGRVGQEHIHQHAGLIRSAGMVLCQLELPIETVVYTIELCAKAGVPVMLDPAPAALLPDAVWPRITWFTPNETEASFYLRGEANVEEAASQLRAKGVKGVVLKRGRDGIYLIDPHGDGERVPGFPVEVVDTVAAGDCFNGAFAVALMERQGIAEAARFAAAAAAISVTRRGAQESMPVRAEVDAFLERRR